MDKQNQKLNEGNLENVSGGASVIFEKDRSDRVTCLTLGKEEAKFLQKRGYNVNEGSNYAVKNGFIKFPGNDLTEATRVLVDNDFIVTRDDLPLGFSPLKKMKIN